MECSGLSVEEYPVAVGVVDEGEAHHAALVRPLLELHARALELRARRVHVRGVERDVPWYKG